MVIHNRSGKNWNTQYVFARYQQYKAYSSKFILTETVISNLKKWLYFTRNFLRLFNTFAMNSDRICDVWYCRICRACSSLLIHVYFHFAQNLVTTVLYTVLHCLKAHFVIMGYHANLMQCCCRDLFQVLRPRPIPWPSGLETKTETWTKWTRVYSSLETMVSRSQHWLHQFQLMTEHSLKGATNYGNLATGVGTKHAVLRPKTETWSSGLETKTETLDFRSRDRDLDKMNSSALESRNHGLEITTLI